MAAQAQDPELAALVERVSRLRAMVRHTQLEVETCRETTQALLAMSRALSASSRQLIAASRAGTTAAKARHPR